MKRYVDNVGYVSVCSRLRARNQLSKLERNQVGLFGAIDDGLRARKEADKICA